jgi:hypothetical protein
MVADATMTCVRKTPLSDFRFFRPVVFSENKVHFYRCSATLSPYVYSCG